MAPLRAIGRAILVVLAAAPLVAAGCGERSDVRIARRILENHRRRAHARPMPGAQVLRLALSAAAGRESAEGSGRIEWEGGNYRETLTSGPWTIVRGIQAGKAFWSDEDGVTRVASEPVLAELLTRSYFWRKAFLFDDLEGAKIALGPAVDTTASVDLSPRGGNPLRLTFDRNGNLLSAKSPRFHLEFRTPSLLTDLSRPRAPVQVEIRAANLPSASLADVEAGGWSAKWTSDPAEATLLREGATITEGEIFWFNGSLAGRPARICLDAAADGPLQVRESFFRPPGLSPQEDVFGRHIARAGPFAVGTLSYPELVVDFTEGIPRLCDARAGAVFLRETIVEFDFSEQKIRFYDPRRWNAPPGYFKGLLDDDGDRAVAILGRGGSSLRLRAGVPGGGIVLAPETALRLGLSGTGGSVVADDLKWGTAPLTRQPVRVAEGDFDPAWGDEGALGLGALTDFHTFLDLPRRWAYLRPRDAGAGVR